MGCVSPERDCTGPWGGHFPPQPTVGQSPKTRPAQEVLTRQADSRPSLHATRQVGAGCRASKRRRWNANLIALSFWTCLEGRQRTYSRVPLARATRTSSIRQTMHFAPECPTHSIVSGASSHAAVAAPRLTVPPWLRIPRDREQQIHGMVNADSTAT